MKKVLLDTDVILDFFFDRKPFADFSAAVLNLCAENKIIGFATPVIISNVYYILRKTGKHETIIEKLKQLLQIIEIADMNKEAVLQALHSEFKDFEDALQNFSAVVNKAITIVLIRNFKDFKTSTLVILSPETFLKGFELD